MMGTHPIWMLNEINRLAISQRFMKESSNLEVVKNQIVTKKVSRGRCAGALAIGRSLG